jgi:hypothetical protein
VNINALKTAYEEETAIRPAQTIYSCLGVEVDVLSNSLP